MFKHEETPEGALNAELLLERADSLASFEKSGTR